MQLGITLGDPAGVGPEITCRALASLAPQERSRIRVFGPKAFLERADALCRTGLGFVDGAPATGEVRVSDVRSPGLESVDPGRASAAGGAAAYGCIAAAVKASLAGEIDCIVTAPINKAALNAAGHAFSGHTELLAHLTGAPSSFMLLASEKLSTIHVSTHVSLASAIGSANSAASSSVWGWTCATRSVPVTAHTASAVAATSERSPGGSHGASGAAESNVLVAASRRPTWPDPAS